MDLECFGKLENRFGCLLETCAEALKNLGRFVVICNKCVTNFLYGENSPETRVPGGAMPSSSSLSYVPRFRPTVISRRGRSMISCIRLPCFFSSALYDLQPQYHTSQDYVTMSLLCLYHTSWLCRLLDMASQDQDNCTRLRYSAQEVVQCLPSLLKACCCTPHFSVQAAMAGLCTKEQQT